MTLKLICVILCSIMSQFVLTESHNLNETSTCGLRLMAATFSQYSETGFNKRKADAPKDSIYCKLTLIFKKKSKLIISLILLHITRQRRSE